MDERIARQEAIRIVANVPSRPEILLRLKNISSSNHMVCVRYIPDRNRLLYSAFEEYLQCIPAVVWQDVSELAFVVMDDLNNQLVPKWIQVMAEKDQEAALIEDRQPLWQNAPLLSRQVIF